MYHCNKYLFLKSIGKIRITLNVTFRCGVVDAEIQNHPIEKPVGFDDDELQAIREDIFKKTTYFREKHLITNLIKNDQVNKRDLNVFTH